MVRRPAGRLRERHSLPPLAERRVRNLVQFDGINGGHPLAPLAQGADGHLYGATWSGGANDQGVIFRLASLSTPQITGEPVSQFVFAGATVRLGVAAAGSPPLYYRWSKNGTNLADGGTIFGASAESSP